MKIDRKNIKHLIILGVSLSNCLLAVVYRYISRLIIRNRKRSIIFYGHTFNGNLKAFYDFLRDDDKYDVYFLSLDKQYRQRLREAETSLSVRQILSGTNLIDVCRAGSADAFITTHGLHFFSILRRFTNIKFIDVWHGVPYKGFDPSDFSHLHAHDQTWVSSPQLKYIYINQFGFQPAQVKATGYARVDQLVNNTLDVNEITSKYGLEKTKKYILIAPTWKQDDKGRSLVPFGVSEKQFFQDVDKIAAKNDATIIFRSHLNSGDSLRIRGLNNTLFMPYSEYENAEEFLYIADVLISDWSSIVFDYLPLRRPTIFLDVPAPFKKGFSLGPEHRFGKVVSSFDELKASLNSYLKSPSSYQKEYKNKIAYTTEVVYGDTLDGKAAQRYNKELNELLKKKS